MDADVKAARLDRYCNAPVWWALVVLLGLAVLALPWTQANLLAATLWSGTRASYALATAIGAMVGAGELLSRYRDEPWRVSVSPPGLVFIAANGAAGACALFLLDTYPETFAAPAGRLTRALLAGFGAMVVLRTKLFTLRQPGGEEIQVGPAQVVDAFLAAINRSVDRRRARRRIVLVTDMARRFANHSFADAEPHLRATLLAFQNLDAEHRQYLNEIIRKMGADADLSKLSDEVKFAMVGYDFLTAFGEEAFVVTFEKVAASVPAKGARGGG